MNVAILLKILEALCSVTERDENGNTVAASALALKQSIDLIMQRDPNASLQLNQIIAQVVCNDWGTIQATGQFVAYALTNGLKEKIPAALGYFNQFASAVATK